MKDSIERFVKELGAISIENLVGTEEPQINKNSLCSEDCGPTIGCFSYPVDEPVTRHKK